MLMLWNLLSLFVYFVSQHQHPVIPTFAIIIDFYPKGRSPEAYGSFINMTVQSVQLTNQTATRVKYREQDMPKLHSVTFAYLSIPVESMA